MLLREREHRMALRARTRAARVTIRTRAQAINNNKAIETGTALVSTVTLQALPIETFHHIISYLSPHSALSLSNTCRHFQIQLSYHSANRVWYDILPPLLLKVEEIQPIPLDRTPVRALGGPYTANLNYQCEIKSHVRDVRKCSLCFLTNLKKDPSKTPPMPLKFGQKMCKKCFNESSITRTELESLLCRGHLPWLHYLAKEIVHCKIFFYRPTVDTALRQVYGIGLSDMELDRDTKQVNIWRESIENRCVAQETLRERIVEVAEQVWSLLGVVCSSEDNLDDLEPWIREMAAMCTRDGMRAEEMGSVLQEWSNLVASIDPRFINIFRSRFAPTIAQFLFPTCDQSSNKWLTNYITTMPQSNQRILCEAIRMIFCLVYFERGRVSEYIQEDRGGSVTTWIEACKAWHRKQIDNELKSGSIMRMDFISVPMANALHDHGGMHRGIKQLRTKLGLPEYPPRASTHLFTAKDFGEGKHINTHTLTEEEYQEAMKREKAANKYFHKICLQACHRCPISSYSFSPVGVEGLIEHVRLYHPLTFWVGEIHLLA